MASSHPSADRPPLPCHRAPGFYQLDAAVTNPRPDLRKKYEWSARPAFPAGTVFRVFHDTTLPGAPACYDLPGAIGSALYPSSRHGGALYAALAAAPMTPVAQPIAERLDDRGLTALEVLEALDGGACRLTDELLDAIAATGVAPVAPVAPAPPAPRPTPLEAAELVCRMYGAANPYGLATMMVNREGVGGVGQIAQLALERTAPAGNLVTSSAYWHAQVRTAVDVLREAGLLDA